MLRLRLIHRSLLLRLRRTLRLLQRRFHTLLVLRLRLIHRSLLCLGDATLHLGLRHALASAAAVCRKRSRKLIRIHEIVVADVHIVALHDPVASVPHIARHIVARSEVALRFALYGLEYLAPLPGLEQRARQQVHSTGAILHRTAEGVHEPTSRVRQIHELLIVLDHHRLGDWPIKLLLLDARCSFRFVHVSISIRWRTVACKSNALQPSPAVRCDRVVDDAYQLLGTGGRELVLGLLAFYHRGEVVDVRRVAGVDHQARQVGALRCSIRCCGRRCLECI